MIRILLMFFLTLCSLPTLSAQESFIFDNPTEQQRFNDLCQQLRCLVCQNQTISDSNAPLAKDLRTQVATLIVQKKSDEQIIAYLTERYGQFIHYKPAVTQQTWLLWFGPFILLLMGFFILITIVYKRNQKTKHLGDKV